MESTSEQHSTVSFVVEKEELFRLLEDFFNNCEYDPVIDELITAFLLTKRDVTDEAYNDLLEKIYFSSVEIPGLIISYGYIGDGYSFKVSFTNRPPEKKEGFDNLQKKVEDTNSVIGLSQQGNEDTSSPNHEYYCDELESIRKDVNKLKSLTLRKIAEDEEEEITNVKDSYSFIMVRPLSFAAFVGFLIFCIQISASVLAVSNQFFGTDKAPYQHTPPLIVPRGVDRTVHAGQGIAIFLVTLVQEGLWEATLNLSNGYGTCMVEQGIIKKWWYLSNMLRFTEGLVATAVTYILIVESDDVVALFKDFTAITFVSSFDNIVYGLAGMNVIGKYMKETFEECEVVTEKRNFLDAELRRNPTYKFLRQLRSLLFHPSVMVLSLLIIMYASWVQFLLIPHVSGYYLCQNLFIQLDDDVNSDLSFHSGTYQLLGSGQRRGAYQGYREVKSSLTCEGCKERAPLILIYCPSKGYWVFVYEGTANEQKKECDFTMENHLIRSARTNGEAKFDVFDVEDEWEVFDDDGYMPLEDFVVRCQDIKPQYPMEKVNGVCEKVQVDERTPEFVAARKWSNKYEKVVQGESSITVYHHPVFQHKNSVYDFDLLLFMGKRWAILSSRQFEDFACTSNPKLDCPGEQYQTKLHNYLQNEFHGKWSKYTVGFFSDIVILRSPKDTLSPLDISWLHPTMKVSDELQAADEKRKIFSAFICAKCEAKENPCFFNGDCQPTADCACTTGSDGVLCQVVPTKNGVCDFYFNKREFDFDGGDCCKKTCVSSATQRCGFDKSGKFVTEYDACEVDTTKSNCQNFLCIDEVFPQGFYDLIVVQVSISDRGKSIALIEAGGRTVRVYDNDGMNWKMRGSSITSVISPSSSSVQIAAYDFMANKINPDRFYPVTVAIKTEKSIKLFQWMNNFWEETFTGIETHKSEVKDFQLLNDGNSLGLFFDDRSFQFFRRENYYEPWKETFSTRRSFFEYFSCSKTGSRCVFADQNCLSTHDMQNFTAKKCFERKLTKIALSRNGNYAAILEDLGFENGNIQLFNVTDGGITSIYSNLRGVRSKSSFMSVSDNGNEFIVASATDLKLFTWHDNTWFDAYETSIDSVVSIADWSAATYTTIGKRTTESAGEVKTLAVYFDPSATKFLCGTGEDLYRFTIILDDYPEQTLWQIQFEDDAKMIQGSKYADKEMTVTENICLKKNDCVSLAIFDTRGDGIIDDDTKKYAGFSLKNKMVQEIDGTFGFEKIIDIEGFKSCPKISRPWKRLQLHERCTTNTCFWNQKGGSLTGEREEDGFGKAIGFSSDGKRLVVGIEFYDGANGLQEQIGSVKVFEFRETNNEWNQIGNQIFGDKPSQKFGYSVALSADGDIFLASGKYYRGNSTELDLTPNTGYVRAYKYDESKNEWLQLGNEMVALEPNDNFGESVSTSADGLIVAVGVMKSDGNGKDSGKTIAFSFNDTDKKWHQMGQPIEGESTRDFAGYSVSLSSNGQRLAIGADWNDGEYLDPIDSIVKVNKNSGSTRVFEYISNEWKQIGNDIDGENENDYAGRSVSLSMDGMTLAVGSVHNSDAGKHAGSARVYEYNPNTKKWNKVGQDIDGLELEDEFGTSVSLSESGTILAVGAQKNSDFAFQAGHVRVFQYVERIQKWHQIGNVLQGLAENDRFGRSAVLSKDGSKIAIGSPGHANPRGPRVGNVRVFEFAPTTSNNDGTTIKEGDCDLHQSKFRLEIKSDKFPEDIEWALFNAAGNYINIEDFRLLPNVDELKEKRLPDRQECISRTEPSTFLIIDKFGDGVCCDWGEGSFSVFVDDEKVLTNVTFQEQSSICLPLDNEIQPFTFDIILDDSPSSSWWLLYDGTTKKTLNRVKFYGGKAKNSQVRWATCVRKENCIIFVMGDNNLAMNGFNGLKEGSGYEISLSDKVYKPRTYKFNSTDVVRMGDSCTPPPESILVQIIIYAGFTAEDMKWDLFDVSDPDEILLSGGELLEMTSSYHEIVVRPNSCLIFRMLTGMDASYTIMWDKNVIYEGQREFNPVPLIRFGSCTQCAQGSKLFQASAHFLAQGSGGSWFLHDLNNALISRGGDSRAGISATYHESCVPEQCLSVRASGDKTISYQFLWDGVLLKFVTPNGSDQTLFGTCETCSKDGLSLLEIMINTGRYMDKVNWSVGTKNKTTAVFENRQTDNRNKVAFENEYYAKCVNITECLYLNFQSVCHGDTCVKIQLRGDRKVLDNIIFSTTMANLKNRKIDFTGTNSTCVD